MPAYDRSLVRELRRGDVANDCISPEFLPYVDADLALDFRIVNVPKGSGGLPDVLRNSYDKRRLGIAVRDLAFASIEGRLQPPLPDATDEAFKTLLSQMNEPSRGTGHAVGDTIMNSDMALEEVARLLKVAVAYGYANVPEGAIK